MSTLKLSESLKTKRKDAGLSVKAVVEQLHIYSIDVSEKTVYGWESGHRQPDADTFLMLCQIYGVTSLSEFVPMIKQDDLSHAERDLIERFRALDTHGKELIGTVLDKEYERCQEQQQLRVVEPKPTHILQEVARGKDLDHLTEEDLDAALKVNEHLFGSKKEGK